MLCPSRSNVRNSVGWEHEQWTTWMSRQSRRMTASFELARAAVSSIEGQLTFQANHLLWRSRTQTWLASRSPSRRISKSWWITLLLGLVMVAWSFGGPITKLMNRLFSKYIFNIPSPFWIENSTQQLDGDGANWARNRVLVPAISSFIDFWRFFHRLLFDPKGLRPTSQMKRVIVYKVEVRKNGRIYQSTINIVRCRKRDAYLP